MFNGVLTIGLSSFTLIDSIYLISKDGGYVWGEADNFREEELLRYYIFNLDENAFLFTDKCLGLTDGGEPCECPCCFCNS